MYFLRLARLKPAVEEIAKEAWEGFSVRFPPRWLYGRSVEQYMCGCFRRNKAVDGYVTYFCCWW